MASIKFTGVTADYADLKVLGKKLTKKVMTRALRKAANEVLKTARKNAKVFDNKKTPGNFSKNLTVQMASRSSKKSGSFIMRVGFLGGARSPSKQGSTQGQRRRSRGKNYAIGKGGNTYYWRFLEFGTVRISQRAFMVKSLNESSSQVLSTFLKWYKQGLAEAQQESRQTQQF